MIYLKLFEEFETSDLTLNLLNEKITLDEYLISIENSLNESLLSGIAQFFTNFKTKVLDGLFTFLKQAAKVGFKIFDAVLSLVKLAMSQISKFKEKNPTLFKIIVITLIILFLMIISASSACAQAAGKPIDPSKIEMAIGWIKMNNFSFAEGKEEGWKILNQSMTYLVDLKDGKIDGDYTQRVADLAGEAIKSVTDMTKQAKKDDSVAQMCQKLLENGKDFISNPKYFGGGIGVIK
jgi:hypothetical protein